MGSEQCPGLLPQSPAQPKSPCWKLVRNQLLPFLSAWRAFLKGGSLAGDGRGCRGRGGGGWGSQVREIPHPTPLSSLSSQGRTSTSSRALGCDGVWALPGRARVWKIRQISLLEREGTDPRSRGEAWACVKLMSDINTERNAPCKEKRDGRKEREEGREVVKSSEPAELLLCQLHQAGEEPVICGTPFRTRPLLGVWVTNAPRVCVWRQQQQHWWHKLIAWFAAANADEVKRITTRLT